MTASCRELHFKIAVFIVFTIFNIFFVEGRHAGVKDAENSTDFLVTFLNQSAEEELFYEEKFQLNCSIPICDGELSEIYCSGPLIFASWYFGFQGSCPGTRLRYSPSNVLHNFKQVPRPLNRTTFKDFCDENFEQTPYLKPAVLEDWKAKPANFERISDAKMKKFAVRLHNIWPELSREFVADVFHNHSLYPVLAVPNRFIVPGGFFQVYFYWDTFWIIRGLLFSQLHDTALGILRNFALIVKTRGFIPNSGNVELSRRSQPPLFIQMLYDYYNEIGANNARKKSFRNEFLSVAERELQWWRANRSVFVTKNSKTYQLYQYRSATNCPRPENFLEDYSLGRRNGINSEFYWSSTASACESGIDFSTRWFSHNVENRTGMETNFVVPVDLNVFIVQNFRIMAEFYKDENKEKSKQYEVMAVELQNAINEVFFDARTGVWFDYDLREKRLRINFYPSNIFPLLLNKERNVECSKIMNYLDGLKIFDFKGGIPSSLDKNSKEQWDFPNAWAPSNHLFVTSLLNCDSLSARANAKKVADAFLTTVFNGLFNPLRGYNSQVWEKYDVRFDNGISGFGGEYPAQTGFGWTNGAVLDFIRMFYTEKEVTYLESFPFDKTRRDRKRIDLRNIYKNFGLLNFSITSPKFVWHSALRSPIICLGLSLCFVIAILYIYVNFVRNREIRNLSRDVSSNSEEHADNFPNDDENRHLLSS